MRVHARAGSKKDEGVVDLCADCALDNWPSTGGEVGGQLPRIIHNAPIGSSAVYVKLPPAFLLRSTFYGADQSRSPGVTYDG